ncbi:MAG: hypothetical protein HYT42_00650 [Candidatus Sungbacteria bacterium]|nr:hypothetical protein [Candidatus Sungbacteria bacterium]
MKFQKVIKQLTNNIYVIVGVVFVWRGGWVILDVIDRKFFGGENIIFAVATIAIGIGLMYLHDHHYDRLDHF